MPKPLRDIALWQLRIKKFSYFFLYGIFYDAAKYIEDHEPNKRILISKAKTLCDYSENREHHNNKHK